VLLLSSHQRFVDEMYHNDDGDKVSSKLIHDDAGLPPEHSTATPTGVGVVNNDVYDHVTVPDVAVNAAPTTKKVDGNGNITVYSAPVEIADTSDTETPMATLG
jgi:hypothetical protein